MNETSQTIQISGTTFGFSAIGLDDLGSDSYTTVTIAVDTSGSVEGFQDDIVKCIQQIVEACRQSPRADNLLLRVVLFANTVGRELHGFKELNLCKASDYERISVGGVTALFDASLEALGSVEEMGKQLTDRDYDCNGLVVVITDGLDNASTYNATAVGDRKRAILRNEEGLESLLSILIGIGIQDPVVSTALKSFEKEGGFDQYVESANADAKTLAKLAQFVSQSISSQSRAIGSGGPSQVINPSTLMI